MRMTFIPHRITCYVVHDRSMTPSSLKFQHLQNFLKITHTSFSRLLLHLTVPSSFPSITCFRKQFLYKMWPTQFAFSICNVWTFSPSWLHVTLLHFSHDRSNWSSPSFTSTTFQNFPVISDLFSEMSKSQHHTKLCSKCLILLVSSLQWSPICWYRVFLMLNAAFAMAILHLISRVHLASFAIMPPKHFNYSTQSYLNIKLYFISFLSLNSTFSQWLRLWVRTARSLGRHYEHFRRKHRRHLRDTLEEHKNCSIINMENGMSLW